MQRNYMKIMLLFFILYFQNWKYKLEVNVNGSTVFWETSRMSRPEPNPTFILYPLFFNLTLAL